MTPTLGQQLRRARIKRGLNLQDVAHVTRIPVSRLADLEDDNYNTHGGLIYAKNFLRTYSKFLEVDASQILDRLQPPPIAGVKDYKYLLDNLGTWLPERNRTPSVTPHSRHIHSPRHTLLTLSMITGCISLVVFSLMYANSMFEQTDTPYEEGGIATTTLSAPIAEDQANLSKTTFNPNLTTLPALPAEEAKKVSWNTPNQPLQLPLQYVSPASATKAQVMPQSRPSVPKAIPVE